MKIGIGDTDVPRNEAIRSDIDLFFGHDECAIEQCEIADRTLAILADRERAARVTRNIFSDNHSARLFADQLAKNLRAFAVKSFTELYIWRDRLWPPIILNMSILPDVAHEGKCPEP